MNCRSKVTLIAASLWLAASAQALEAKLHKDDLPVLSPEVQHETASKRVTSRFTALIISTSASMMISLKRSLNAM